MAATGSHPVGHRISFGERVFLFFLYVFFLLFTLICVYPFYYLIINSISANDVSARGGDDPAGQQKGAGLVRHPGDVGIAHETCPFASFFCSCTQKAAPGDSSPGAAHCASLRRCGIRR